MIVQPASIGPRSPRRRAIRALGLALPVVLLGGVVTIAITGPQPADDQAESSAAAAVAASATAGAEAPAAPGEADPNAVADPAGERTVFPARIAGLDVHGVQWTLEARSRGLVRGGLVAIAGYLSLDPEPSACQDRGEGVIVPFCDRSGVLSEDPWTGREASERGLPPFHLHPQVPLGVRVPLLVGSAARAAGTATPVILLARFDDPRAAECLPAGRHCGQELVVERVAWVSGAPYPRGLAVEPGIAGAWRAMDEIGRQADIAVAALPEDGYPLLAALVTRETLERLDAEAARVATARAAFGAVWYVRGLDAARDPGSIEWAVVDAVRERVLASGTDVLGPRGPGDDDS